MAVTRQPNIPDLVDTSPNSLIAWARQLRQALGVLSGDIPTTDQSALDQAVTFRDLIDNGIAVEAPAGSKNVVLPGDGSSSDYATPPAPGSLTVTRLPFNMRLTWIGDAYAQHDYTEVWRSATNNLSSAAKIAEVPRGNSLYEDGYLSAAFYWVRFVSKAGVIGGFNAISGTSSNSQPGDVTNLTAIIEGFGIRLRWNPITDADLAAYELRLGSTWATGAPLEGGPTGSGTDVGGTTYLWRIQAAGTYRVWCRARDVTGFYSGTAISVDVTIAAPSAVTFAGGSPISGDTLALSWSSSAGSFQIDSYEIRVGNAWAGATVLDRALSNVYLQKVNWGGTRRFWVAARDVAGNYGNPISSDVVVTSPGQVASIRAEVVDNNVLLYWTTPSTGTLPVLTYEVYRGTAFAGATLIGEKSGLFTSVFEQSSGNFTYWIRPRDTAGNVGVERSVTTFVNQPPDYVLYSDLNPALSGATRSNADFDGGIVFPFNTAESWDTHYTSRGWANDNDAIAAGFPIYAQPAPGSGHFEVQIDYGAVIPSTGIQVSPTLTVIAGSPTNIVQISYKLNLGDAWIDLAAGSSGFIAASFRYVRVRVTATTSGGGVGLYRCTNLNIKLNVKQKSFASQGTCNSGDAGGTTFHLTNDGNPYSAGVNALLFVDAFGPPVIQPAGTSPIIAVVDFVDTPNPQSFKVLLFNNNGVRVSAAISWTARGV